MSILTIDGFKCFKRPTSFELKPITVFTGANGTGKSTVIQSILLLRLAIERNSHLDQTGYYDCSSWIGNNVPLNNDYELKLGTNLDIFNDNDDFKGNKIHITIDDVEFILSIPKGADGKDADGKDYIEITPLIKKKCINEFLEKREFYYLHTERLGPRFISPVHYTDFTHCGYQGEYTAQILSLEIEKVEEVRRHLGYKSASSIRIQTDAWIKEICPGTSITPVSLDALTAQIRIRNGSSQSDLLSTNIGFGISYSLPIIVTGLIAKKGSVMIVENPEAHLHPKGQSNMGFFLGMIAASGIQVVIESHSEHIVNGIRRAMMSNIGLNHSDISMYFFNGFEKQSTPVTPILVQESGDLTPFPRDYFDQVQQDMAAILRMQRERKNGFFIIREKFRMGGFYHRPE